MTPPKVMLAAISGTDLADIADVTARVADARLAGLSYRPTPEAEPQQVTLAAARGVRFEDAAPIRQPMAYQGQRSKPGYYLMARTGRLVSYESRFEMAHLMLIDRDPTVVAVASQPFRLHWGEVNQRPRVHVPDIFVRRTDGSCEVVGVKGSRSAARPENALVFGVTGRACAEMRMRFRVASDIDPVVIDNQRWLAGYRFATEGVADLGPYVLDAVLDPRPLRLVVSAVVEASRAHPAHVKRVLFHLLWAGIVHCDLTTPLSGNTVVHAEREAVGHVS